MILRRLAEAVREQNWFTVVLEVLIVVVGIFIGLQVDDWAERRATRQLYGTALEAFLVESTSNRELLDRRIQQIEGRIPDLEKALLHLIRCDKAPGIETTLNEIIDMSYSSISPQQAFVAYESVTANTRFQEAMSKEFRQSLSSYYSQFLKAHEWLVRNAQTIDPASSFERSKVVSALETDNNSTVYRQFRFRLNAPFEIVCKDRDFVRDAMNLHAIHAVNLRLSKAMQDRRDVFDFALRIEINRAR